MKIQKLISALTCHRKADAASGRSVKRKFRLSPVSVGLLSASLFMPAAIGAGSDRLGAYDFSYEVNGDQRVRPVQVFDDGRSTYFQFRSGEAIPAIFADTSAGAALQVPTLEGPYVKVPSLAGAFALRLGYGASRVSYVGAHRPAAQTPSRPDTTAMSANAGAVPRIASTERLLAASHMVSGLPREMFQAPTRTDALEANSYATPIKGDAVEWTGPADRAHEHPITFGKDSSKLSPSAVKLLRSLVASARPATRFEVLGRDDEGHKEKVAEARAQAVVSALVSAGASRASITHRSTSEVKEAGKGLWYGANLRVTETASAPSPTLRGGDEAVADIVRRLQAGRLTPSEALALLDRARHGAAAPVQAPPPIHSWAMRKSDENIQRMLERWAKDAGWRLVWKGGPDVAITGDAAVAKPDFIQAADYVISQAKTAGYQMRATAYSNQTLVISGDKE